MPNAAANWKRLSPLLDAALDLPAAQRASWLDSLPPEHSDLRERLKELLDTHPGVETGDFLKRLPKFSGVPAALKLESGSVVGPYRLLHEIGSGGTATVWLAERVDGSIQRRIALKLPHLGLVDRGIAERIAREREILSSLEHPNIARLYDAGVDERGRPYLALEYVDGIPPDEFCRRERLGLRDKLTLFVNMLRAVSFAHARLIVHRDLKPTNILVREDSSVLLLDFGIARLLTPDSPGNPAHTIVGAAALTPAYAAPEQFTGQPVTVATDVYSLGVILYELLTGVSPYSIDGRSIGAYEHAVRYEEPPRMSRAASPAESRDLAGDLDAIVAKALEKNPRERYVSADAFANDIERYLAAEPIMARPRSFAYVARKFLRRNALSLIIAVSVVVVLSGALGFAASQWKDAERQRSMAVERLANSRAAEEFSATVLIENIQPGQALSFEQLIARSEQIARDTGANDLRTRIFATEFLANWYSANALYQNAEAVLTRTIDSLPADAPLVGATLRCKRARLWVELGRPEDSIAVLDEMIALADADDAVASRCLNERSSVAASNADAHGSLAFALEALRRYERAGVESVFERADLLTSIGGSYGIMGRFAEANEKYGETLQLFERAGRRNSRAAANLRDDWATSWMNSGNPRRGLEEIDHGWEIMQELAPAAQDSDKRLLRRGRLLAQLGRFDEALADFKRGGDLAEARGNLGNLASIRLGQADVHLQNGRLREAGFALDAAAAVLHQAQLARTNLVNVRYVLTRAEWLAARGDSDAARNGFGHALALYESQNCCRATRALVLAERAEVELDFDLPAAATDAASARELAPAIEAESFSRFTGLAWHVSGRVFEKQGKLRDARDAFARAAVQFAGALGESHPETLRARAGIERASLSLQAGTPH